jgi:ferritin-like metal-binding protein YciE
LEILRPARDVVIAAGYRLIDATPEREPMSSVANLRELFLDEVKDLLNAERQLVMALPKMIHAATSVPLKDALASHLKETEGHIDRMEQILTDLGESPRGKKCKGMEGILEEGSEMLSHVEMPALDAAIVSTGQRVAHYEISGYGVIQDWAKTLGYRSAEKLIVKSLEEALATTERLSALAKGGINTTASAGEGIPVR